MEATVLRLGEVEALFDARDPRIQSIDADGLFGELHLHMSEAGFEVANPDGPIIKPGLNPVDRRADVPKVFKDEVFDGFGHSLIHGAAQAAEAITFRPPARPSSA